MDLELRGKRALITGGTRGIGKAIVLALAKDGVDVVTCARGHGDSGDAVAALRAELAAIGGEHLVCETDLTADGEAERLAQRCAERFGGLDLVVHNAAAVVRADYPKLGLAEWEATLAANVTAVHRLTTAVLPLLGRGSSVVAISSRSAELGLAGRVHYTASKAALHGWNRSLAQEYGPAGIRFNLLTLGMVHTEVYDGLAETDRAALLARFHPVIALGRLATPDEVADAVRWLASDLSGYVTGTAVTVDGALC
ncbi:SDR family NAD(P)-dependent oxidoreductase [Amycolatopsis regifaucium]|uniref:Short-chain dehydrogenase n=1 Tax=Amycolatopsis regifaucium TaxID=546365 RepID=A0A154MVF5_9PSEU|nr:SDR family NAD(P)-dependent oxidoreductase [Amycolatopsis regifaucium]KZB88334.1 short-chain dehydrogenase [Amycolatopsis regifaucium]OKA11445.1 short-chain dehydrogenase [Amycolatopsis regifaucium]SFH41623.1 3-oxoacyl-[acyl-carrier protein] reductase [Amycolatopsis regifaucium]